MAALSFVACPLFVGLACVRLTAWLRPRLPANLTLLAVLLGIWYLGMPWMILGQYIGGIQELWNTPTVCCELS